IIHLVSPFCVMSGWSVTPFKMVLRALFAAGSLLNHYSWSWPVGVHASLDVKGYTFLKEKTLSLNRSGDPMCRLLRGDAHAYDVGWTATG
ncbi:MAG: hypothetical protein ABI684_12580, partial [Nitrospirota bacterium]